MLSQEYLNLMKDIHQNILDFLEDESESGENFQNLEDIFINTRISNSRYNFLSLLHLITKIGNNHHRFSSFFSKIEKILQFFKEDIKKYFSNSQLFNIFKSNKKILLYLIEQQIIVFDKYIVKTITTTCKYIDANYPEYFQPEIQPFINEKWFPKYNRELKKDEWIEHIKKELPENFYELRKKGENSSQICELIRNDMITDFVVYITKHNISPNAKIQPSIYETNSFLLKDQKNEGFSLIEYAAFFGSIQIFNHLRFVNAKLTSRLWYLAIHGKNAEIIHFLEDNYVELEDKSYKKMFYESIKCHHIEIANYFMNNFFKKSEEDSFDTLIQCLKYYDFAFFQKELIIESSFYYFCKYDFCTLVDFLLKNENIDINNRSISFLFNIISYDNFF